MKNLKKVLAFVTMFTMLLSVAVSAGTLYADVADNASYAEAVTTLNALGIMIGDDQGNFNPEASITRAETAAVVTRMKAMGEAASAAGGTKFADVAADHWAAGYINLAEQSGIINGYGDGNFGPEDEVTYEQVIKMIVAALGYTPEAITKGGYPSGYMIIASREEITKGVSVTAGAGAPRAAVARMVFNALDVPVMEQVRFKAGEEEYAAQDGYKYPLKTLLKNDLKVDKYEGIVTDTYLTAGVDPDDSFIKILVNTVNGSKDDEVYEEIGTEVSFEEGKTNAADLFANYVVAYVAEDEETGKATLVGIAKKSGKNNELALDYTQIVDFTAPDASPDPDVLGELAYHESETSTTETKVDIAVGVKYVYNGKTVNAEEAVADFFTDVEAGVAPVVGNITLIDNNNDDVYDFIFLMQATNYYLVDSVDADAKRLEDKTGATIPLDVEDENVIINFYKADGSAATFADIKAGDVLTTYESDDAKIIAVYISDKKVEGTVSEQIPASNDDDSFVIGGNEYRIAYDLDTVPQAPVSVGDDGVFYLNHEDRIVAKDAAALSGNYAYLLNAVLTSDINGAVIEVKYVDAEGKVETALLANKVTPVVDGTVGSAITTSAIADQFAPLFEVVTTETEIPDEDDDPDNNEVITTKTVEMGTAQQRLFQFSKNASDKINKLFVINENDNEEAFSMDLDVEDKTYKASQNKLGNMYFNDETLVLSIGVAEDATGIIDEDDVTLTKVSSFFTDDTDYECLVEAYDIENGIPSIVLVYDASVGILEGTKGLLVTKVSTVVNANGGTTTKVYGFQNGEEVTAELADDCEGSVAAGDFVTFAVDTAGDIDQINVLITAADAEAAIADAIEGTPNELIGVNDEAGEYSRHIFGFAQKRKTGGQMILAENWVEGADVLVDEEGDDLSIMLAANGASFYEVNLLRTPNAYSVSKYASIKTESRPSIAEGTQRISNWLFVREYDGVVIDVVIYTTANPVPVEA